MALRPTDPWYMPPADPQDKPLRRRYQRALRLSRYAAGRDSRDPVYRQRCIDNWKDYLDGKIEPPAGRKPKADAP